MNKEELFVIMHETFTGKKNTKNHTLQEYENLTPQEGLAKAEQYLAWAKRVQDTIVDTEHVGFYVWAYWGYAGDITMAEILIAIFKALVNGITDFPEVPNVEGMMLMDKTATLQAWALNLSEPRDFSLSAHRFCKQTE